MRGLPFPQSAVLDREQSYERGTPSSIADEIPIDPALSGPEPIVDHAIMSTESNATVAQQPIHPQYSLKEQQYYVHEFRQYSQGPQGDPFAPPPSFLPVQEQVVQPTPKPKRKRKPRREEECGFCQLDDQRNKLGQPEVMVTCEECGRSGHPTCMDLGQVSAQVRSYPWKCIDCKTCEVCEEKSGEEQMLFCDYCDRGWHMECLQPPLEESPPGKWHCPKCPPLESFESIPAVEPKRRLSLRSQSVASSIMGKGKEKAVPTDESDVDVDETPTAAKNHTRRKSRKGKARAPTASEEEERSSSPVRLPKRTRLRIRSPVPPPTPRRLPTLRLKLPAKGKGKEREEDEEKKGMFDEILGPDDRDTSKTLVESADKQRFERSRVAAEEKVIPPPPSSSIPEEPLTPIAGPSTRPLRSSGVPLTNTTPLPARSTSPASSALPPSGLRIRTIRFGQFDIQTWYDAPFPEEYATIPDGRLWICEFCLKYMKSRFGAVRHRMKCKARHPPGDEIYRDGAVSIFEVDGRKNKIYCQNLCLLSKMFLDHKSLFYDVEPFLFYVMAEVDDGGAHFVGYFSKEKRSPKDYNVSCIMTLPVRQRQGWGNLLIDFSYLLSKKEQRVGSPEKPLSGLGALGYKNYWTLAVMRYLDTAPDSPRLEDISAATSMTIEDVHTTLTQQNIIHRRERTPPAMRPSPGQSIKFPRGRKNGIARRHLQRAQTQEEDGTPKTLFVAPTQYEIRWDHDRVAQHLCTWEAKGYLKLRPERLKWSPFLLARTSKTEALGAPSISREDTASQVIQDLFADEVAVTETTTPASDTAIVPESNSPAKRRTLRTPARKKSKEIPPVATRRTSTRSATNGVTGDEALAAKLALEEQRPTRQLRSRTEAAAPELKRTVSESKSPRKRRRVESSPEPDTPVMNSNAPLSHSVSAEPQKDSDLSSPPEDGIHINGDSNPEMKYEDLGTPLTGLTGLTSRQSVPSDDTIAAAEASAVKETVSGHDRMEEEEDEDADAEGDPDTEEC